MTYFQSMSTYVKLLIIEKVKRLMCIHVLIGLVSFSKPTEMVLFA